MLALANRPLIRLSAVTRAHAPAMDGGDGCHGMGTLAHAACADTPDSWWLRDFPQRHILRYRPGGRAALSRRCVFYGDTGFTRSSDRSGTPLPAGTLLRDGRSRPY